MSIISGHYDTKELDGDLCAIVENDATPERADFVKRVLEHNGYTVHIIENEPPKLKMEEGDITTPPTPTSYMIGVTDITFNISLALFGRHLKTLDNEVLLPHYWQTGHVGNEHYWEEAKN
jgi:hypothetical protein